MPTHENNKKAELKELLAKLLNDLYTKKRDHEELVEWSQGQLHACYVDLDPLYKSIKALEYIQGKALDNFQLLQQLIDIESLFLNSSLLGDYQLPDFRYFFHPKILTHEKVDRQLAILEMKSLDLAYRGHHFAASEVKKLVFDLRDLNQWYFSEEKIDYNDYQSRALEIINESRPILEKHRGYKKILANLLILIVTLGTGLLINKAYTGHFLFFKQTDSAKQINTLNRTISSFSVPQ